MNIIFIFIIICILNCIYASFSINEINDKFDDYERINKLYEFDDYEIINKLEEYEIIIERINKLEEYELIIKKLDDY